MSKIRTIQSCFDEIKASDPNTAITVRAIRRAVTEGEIPSRKVGTKYVINLDNVLDYFSGESR